MKAFSQKNLSLLNFQKNLFHPYIFDKKHIL